jgi:hypothetical protein
MFLGATFLFSYADVLLAESFVVVQVMWVEQKPHVCCCRRFKLNEKSLLVQAHKYSDNVECVGILIKKSRTIWLFSVLQLICFRWIQSVHHHI